MKHNYTEFVFFWEATSPFSQWHDSGFTIDGHHYNTAEQYMMHQKALLFGDEEIAEKIMQTNSPGKQKAYGRKVKNFDKGIWVANRLRIVYEGNVAKFSQNENLKKYILGTKGKWLVEASPVDYIWGIGLAKEDPNARNPEEWPGLNLLGEALMQAREKLEQENE